jgi:hypothetical protein
MVAGWLVVAVAWPARHRWHGPARRRRCGPAHGGRWPRRVAWGRRSRGRGVSRARPGPGRAHQRPTHRSRPAIWLRRTRRRPRRPAPQPGCAVGRVGGVGRRAGRGGRADYGTGRVPAWRARPADEQQRRWGMIKGQARWSGLVMGFDNHMIAGDRACPTFNPADSLDLYQPGKPALCRGPGAGPTTGAILPAFCPTDLYRAARPRIVLDGESAWTSADQGECGSAEWSRTDPDEAHPAKNCKVGGSIPSLPTRFAQVSGLAVALPRWTSRWITASCRRRVMRRPSYVEWCERADWYYV